MAFPLNSNRAGPASDLCQQQALEPVKERWMPLHGTLAG